MNGACKIRLQVRFFFVGVRSKGKCDFEWPFPGAVVGYRGSEEKHFPESQRSSEESKKHDSNNGGTYCGGNI